MNCSHGNLFVFCWNNALLKDTCTNFVVQGVAEGEDVVLSASRSHWRPGRAHPGRSRLQVSWLFLFLHFRSCVQLTSQCFSSWVSKDLLVITSQFPTLYANIHVHQWDKQTQCLDKEANNLMFTICRGPTLRICQCFTKFLVVFFIYLKKQPIFVVIFVKFDMFNI